MLSYVPLHRDRVVILVRARSRHIVNMMSMLCHSGVIILSVSSHDAVFIRFVALSSCLPHVTLATSHPRDKHVIKRDSGLVISRVI